MLGVDILPGAASAGHVHTEDDEAADAEEPTCVEHRAASMRPRRLALS